MANSKNKPTDLGIPTVENKFRKENGQVDWTALLWHIWEHQGDGKTLAEWAKEFGVHKVRLCDRMRGFKSFADAVRGDQAEFSAAVTRQALNNKKNQYKLSLERREINSVIRKEAMVERVMDEFIMPNLKPYKPVKYVNKVVTQEGKQGFFISDLHFKTKELNVGLEDIGQMVVDNWDGSKHIRLIFGGDYVEGRHHMDQQITTASTMAQVVEVADIIARNIAFIISNTNAEIHASYIIGNHDSIREGNTRAGDNLKEHIVGTLQRMVGALLKEYKQYFEIGDAAYEISETIGDYSYNFRHGHIGNWADKSLMKNVLNEEMQLERSYDRYVFGHFHRWNDWMKKGVNKRFIICPSMKTFDGNFENANLLRNTVGITTFKENGDVIMIPWKGTKLKDGDLN